MIFRASCEGGGRRHTCDSPGRCFVGKNGAYTVVWRISVGDAQGLYHVMFCDAILQPKHSPTGHCNMRQGLKLIQTRKSSTPSVRPLLSAGDLRTTLFLRPGSKTFAAIWLRPGPCKTPPSRQLKPGASSYVLRLSAVQCGLQDGDLPDGCLAAWGRFSSATRGEHQALR